MTKIKTLDRVIVMAISLFMVAMFSISAMAASYTSTLACASGYKGSVRSYKGNDINFSMTVRNDDIYPYDAEDNKTTVSLYRSGFLGIQSFVSSRDWPRNGYEKNTWTGVGDGKYCFGFTKPCHNVNDKFNWIRSDDVKMYN